MKKLLFVIISLVMLGGFSLPLLVSAQGAGSLPIIGNVPGAPNNPPPNNTGGSGATVRAGSIAITATYIETTIDDIACQLSRLAMALAVIMLVYVGYQFMRAGGDPKNVDIAKKNLTWVMVGIAVIIGVDVIIATVANAINVQSYSILRCAGSAPPSSGGGNLNGGSGNSKNGGGGF